MTSRFQQNKGKRPKLSTDENNSFVKNVTSKMSGFLPTTITKWFSSPRSNCNGSSVVAESTDSSTEDEAPDIQPPSKRMRFSSPGTSNQYGSPETTTTSTNTDPIEAYSTVSLSPIRNPLSSETDFVSTPLSSPVEESSHLEDNEKDISVYNYRDSLTNGNNSIARKRKSLIEPLNDHQDAYTKTSYNTIRDLNKPYVKSVLVRGSPFYPGKTMYGGAASSYMNQPNIKHRNNAHINIHSNNNAVSISHSAKRVLDLLENYSSPLIEAKRISQFMNMSTNSNSSFHDTTTRNNNLAYKTKELHVPSIATILRLKQKSRLMDTTNAARQIIASHSSSPDVTPYPVPKSQSSIPKESEERFTTKIKSRLTRINRGEAALKESNASVKLPTVVLHIDKDNLPKFTLSELSDTPKKTTDMNDVCPIASQSESNMISNSNKIVGGNEIITEPENLLNNNAYDFASPVTINNETVMNTTLLSFSFGSPERNIEEKEKNKNNEIIAVESQILKENTVNPVAKIENWKCDVCWVPNKIDTVKCVCCNAKRPVSNGNKNKNKNKDIDSDMSEPLPVIISSAKWSCPDCWVKNDESKDKCVCCGEKKPKKADSSVTTATDKTSNNKDVESSMKIKSNTSECITCVDENAKQDKPNKVMLQPVIKNAPKNIKKLQNEKWECPSCLVRNDNNKSTCVCCETSKPGTVTETQSKSFSFGQPNVSFKFGIDPKKTVPEKNVEPTQQLALETVVTESETNNNVLTKSQTFTFGLPKKKSDDKIGEAKPTETPKVAFTFGISKENSTKPAVASAMSPTMAPTLMALVSAPATGKIPEEVLQSPEVTQKPEKDQTSKQTEQPKLNLPEPTQKPVVFLSLKQPNISISPLVNSPTSNNDNLIKPDLPNNSLAISTTKTMVEPVAPQNKFTFSSSGLKPAVNLFTPQVTSTPLSLSSLSSLLAPAAAQASQVQQNPTVSKSMPLFQKSDPISSSPLSFFQKSKPISSSPISFFQKNESSPSTISLFKKSESSIPNAASQPLGSNSPIFSFGSNTQNAPQTEKPKFNFTFGRNKSETPLTFKPQSFGATGDNNIGANKFNMGTASGNGLAGNTVMTNNILSGGNGISNGNPLAVSPRGNGRSTGGTVGADGTPNSMTTESNLGLPNSNSNRNSSQIQTTGLFDTQVKKDVWSSTNVSTNNAQKPPPFNFGAPTPYNPNNATTASTFGNTSQNMFGISNQNSQSTLFSSSIRNQAPANMFGGTQSAANSVGMFSAPNMTPSPAFNSSNTTVPSFEAVSMNPAPTFNFGAQQQPTSGIFGFTQQQPQIQQTGVYNFGGQTGTSAPQVQFNMGSAPSTTVRRVRKAIRRTTPR